MRTRHLALMLGATAPAACTQPPPGASVGNDIGSVGGSGAAVGSSRALPATTPEPLTEADYAGRWIGVEGMYLTVAPRAGGGVDIENQWDLDNKANFDGVVTEQGLRFTRNGETFVARKSSGDATGLKWLAGKRDCLTVKPGEGYCRS